MSREDTQLSETENLVMDLANPGLAGKWSFNNVCK